MDEYIRQNRDTYTREAITDQLLAAGHERQAIDAAWRRMEQQAATTGWRPRWVTFVVLLVLGTIGAALVWAGEPYGAGAIAPVVYAVLFSIAFGLGKAMSLLVDRGHAVPAGFLLAAMAIGGAVLSVVGGLPLVALLVAAAGGIPALILLGRANDPRLTGYVAAAIPLIVWVGITGTCYAPLFGRLGQG